MPKKQFKGRKRPQRPKRVVHAHKKRKGRGSKTQTPGKAGPVNVSFRWADPPATRFATTTYSSYTYNMSSLRVLINGGSQTDIDYLGTTINDYQKYLQFRVDHDHMLLDIINNEALPCEVVVFPCNVVNTVNTAIEFAYAKALTRAKHAILTPLTGSHSKHTFSLKCSPKIIATDPVQYRTQATYSGALLAGVPNTDPATMTYWTIAVAYPTISTTLGITTTALFTRKAHLFSIDMNAEVAISKLTASNIERRAVEQAAQAARDLEEETSLDDVRRALGTASLIDDDGDEYVQIRKSSLKNLVVTKQ